MPQRTHTHGHQYSPPANWTAADLQIRELLDDPSVSESVKDAIIARELATIKRVRRTPPEPVETRCFVTRHVSGWPLFYEG